MRAWKRSTTIAIITWFRRRTIRRIISVEGRGVKIWGTFLRTRVIFRWTTRGIRIKIWAWRRIKFIWSVIVMFIISRSITIVIGRICSGVGFSIVTGTWVWAWIGTRLISDVARRLAWRITITSATVTRIMRFIWRIFKMLIKCRSRRSRLWFWFFKHIETAETSWNRVVIFMAKWTIFFELRFWFIIRIRYLNLWRFWRRIYNCSILLEGIRQIVNFKGKFLSFYFFKSIIIFRINHINERTKWDWGF